MLSNMPSRNATRAPNISPVSAPKPVMQVVHPSCEPNVSPTMSALCLQRGGQMTTPKREVRITRNSHWIHTSAICSMLPVTLKKPEEKSWSGEYATSLPSLSKVVDSPLWWARREMRVILTRRTALITRNRLKSMSSPTATVIQSRRVIVKSTKHNGVVMYLSGPIAHMRIKTSTANITLVTKSILSVCRVALIPYSWIRLTMRAAITTRVRQMVKAMPSRNRSTLFRSDRCRSTFVALNFANLFLVCSEILSGSV
mmetsp:Transcript_3775/g.7188  ORF Transcript_3775/g.7188 Transcript_3775/m.7188 type:complete len:256 (-) Transcript_3775:670-1437(-)